MSLNTANASVLHGAIEIRTADLPESYLAYLRATYLGKLSEADGRVCSHAAGPVDR
jgi:hypothetical protein